MDAIISILSFFFIIILYISIFWCIVFVVLKVLEFLKLNYRGETREREYLPYRIKDGLMTKAEKNFFDVLEKVVNNRYYIVPQVNISSLVFVAGTKYYKTYLNKIDRKTVDFVLFNRQFSPVIVIELDDSSHDELSRKQRDDFVDRIMNRVGLKIVHIKTAHTYDPEEINRLILF